MVDIMNILILGGTAWLSSTIARTATQSGFCSGETVGDSIPGVIAVARCRSFIGTS